MDFGTPSTPSGRKTNPRTPARKLTEREARQATKEGRSRQSSEYPTPVQLYSRPPVCDVSLEEFEELAVERLKVLRLLEKHNLGGSTKLSTDWIHKLSADMEKNKLSSYLDLANAVGSKVKEAHLVNRRNDHISHFILRLAYCRTEELRRWFTTHETDLFRLRWTQLMKSNQEALADFMAEEGLSYTPISGEEKCELGEALMAATGWGGISGHKLEDEEFYKVPWIEAVDLVRSRRVLVRGGFAYIPREELLSLVVGVFRSRLSHNLVLTGRALPVLEEDDRLVSMIQNLDKRYTGDDYAAAKNSDKVLPAQIDPLSKKHFPMCMKSCQDTLTSTHHLKYKGRLQYGLFLKGIGLTLEDAMKFFRSEFTKKGDTDVDKFEKEYSYGIRYNYGKEGKKVNWQPWNCMKVIMENVGGGETHGCPFRHHEPKSLREELLKQEVAKPDVDAIVQKVEEGHYQIACGLHFTAVHAKELTTGATNHPNQWYMESKPNFVASNQSSAQAAANSQANVKTTRAVVYSSQASSSQSVEEEKKENDFLDDMDDAELMEMMDTAPER